jgi:1-aminocyclopropane-1-carboxylate deaminase/D-cysteine desulfhydrase-like pyridoxal-dependent ACC family enzyme
MKKLLLLLISISFAKEIHTCEPAKVKALASINFEIKNNNEWIEQLNQAVVPQEKRLQNALEKSCAELALARKFPSLKIPHVALRTLPTPVQKLETLSKEAGTHIFIKRDDATGGQFYGGNKPRKLEFELARALNHGATSVITFGCAGSNHAVATGEHARRLGLKAICMLKPQENSHGVRKNLLLHMANGVELHYAPNNDVRKIMTFAAWNDQINKGEKPYIIPTGGSTPLGTLGFVNAAFELKEQVDAKLIPEPDYIYVPCGSCATTAGLLLGCKAAGLKTKIMAIAVEPEEEVNEFKNNITKLFSQTNELLRQHTNNTFPAFEYNPNDIEINLNFTGPEYAVFTKEGVAARQMIAQSESITIDGTYTAKAFAAAFEHIKKRADHQNKTILLWDTYCGTSFDNRTAQASYKDLPKCFHFYFENDVQELDRK